jgi:hypothetical protein
MRYIIFSSLSLKGSFCPQFVLCLTDKRHVLSCVKSALYPQLVFCGMTSTRTNLLLSTQLVLLCVTEEHHDQHVWRSPFILSSSFCVWMKSIMINLFEDLPYSSACPFMRQRDNHDQPTWRSPLLLVRHLNYRRSNITMNRQCLGAPYFSACPQCWLKRTRFPIEKLLLSLACPQWDWRTTRFHVFNVSFVLVLS